MFTVKQVSKLCNVNPGIVKRWVVQGILKPGSAEPPLFPAEDVWGLLPQRLRHRPLELMVRSKAAEVLDISANALTNLVKRGLSCHVLLPISSPQHRPLLRFARHELEVVKIVPPQLTGTLYIVEMAQACRIPLATMKAWLAAGLLTTSGRYEFPHISSVAVRNCLLKVYYLEQYRQAI
jgi:hypothetical protein